eukprot:378120_1
MTAIRTVEILIDGFIRQNIEQKYNLRHMEKEVKSICIRYYGIIFGDSKIINFTDAIKLEELINTRLSFNKTELIYNSLIDKTDCKTFYSKCESKKPTVLIIKSNFENIFGAFTTVAWKYKGDYYKDDDAFLFVLKSDQKDQCYQLFDVIDGKPSDCAVNFGGGYGSSNKNILCYFGAAAGLLLYEYFNTRNDNFCFGGDKCSYWLSKGNILCGGNCPDETYKEKYQFKVEQLELFQLSTSNHIGKVRQLCL